MKKKHNYIFIITIGLIILIGNLSLVREQKNGSDTENRTFQKFEQITLKGYLEGTYQKKLENALSDQFIAGETIKLKLKELFNVLNLNKIPKFICENKYVRLSNEYYNFDCNDSLITTYNILSENDKINIQNNIESYSYLNEYVDTYYYVVPTSSEYNFEKNEYSVDMTKILEDNLKGKYNLKYLEYKNYDEYKEFFYKTDHHWNYRGSRKAYEDIISILKPKDKLLEIEDEIEFENTIFFGSAARVSQIFDYKENFTVYKYNYPNMNIAVNGINSNYGIENKYYKNEIPNNKLENHYGNFYGSDFAEVMFYTSKTKENLLIIGDSFTNSINKMIATHFNKTYDVDLRHYEKTFGEKFNIKNYVKQNDIDKVLIIVTSNVLLTDEFNIGVVK